MRQNYATRADKELDLLRPIGAQDLYKADWSKNFVNDNRFFRASGYSNASGALGSRYSVGECKNICESLFNKGEERTLREACKSTCKSKCTWMKCKDNYRPTRASVCQGRGLTADCLPAGSVAPAATTAAGTQSPLTTVAGVSTRSATRSSSTIPYVAIGVGVLVLGVGAFFLLRKKKK